MATKARKKFRSETRHAARQERKKKTAAAMPPIVHDGELLANAENMNQDTRLISEAVQNEWPVIPEQQKTIVTRLVGITEKTTVQIPCGEGVFDSEATADANAIRAAALLKAMIDSNKKRGEQKQGTTINVGVSVDNRTDERRDRALAIAERFRNGRVLVSDSSESD